MKIAVIGSGAAGLTAAHLLDSAHSVTLFEKAERLGGHTHTFFIPDGPDAGTPVDTGFIVFNRKNYPLLCRFFEKLDVQTESSDMAFGVASPHEKLEYCSDFPHGLFAWKRNFFKVKFIRMILDILKMNRHAKNNLNRGETRGKTLGEWIAGHKAGQEFRDWYLLPMGAAIWSMPADQMLHFPAEMFLNFFENHGLWDLKNRPQWRFVAGGSQSYIKKIQASFRGDIRTSAGVIRIQRGLKNVIIKTANNLEEFDAVVLAAHADESLGMLEDPSEDEKKHLSAWKYTPNQVVLHWDDSIMPRRRKAWASWNLHLAPPGTEAPVVLTYWMNRLQNLKTKRNYFVTLNASEKINPEKVVREFHYTHPHYDFASLETQKYLSSLNGNRNTYFCGSYFGNGFHEDAVRSAVQVAEMLGVKL